MDIHQGDVYWIDFGEPLGSEPGYMHPSVIIQNDLFNDTRINTVVVCTITENLRLSSTTGNVLLEKDEANLSKASVVNVSQIYTADKKNLLEKLGQLSSDRIHEILEGVYLLLEPRIV